MYMYTRTNVLDVQYTYWFIMTISVLLFFFNNYLTGADFIDWKQYHSFVKTVADS